MSNYSLTDEELAALLSRWNLLTDDERQRLRPAVIEMVDAWYLAEARRDCELQAFLSAVLRG